MLTLTYGDVIVTVATVAGFFGVIFAAGKLSARVDALEEWKRSLNNGLDGIHASIRELKMMLTGKV